MAQGEGDLTKRLDDSAKDELGEICRYFVGLEKSHFQSGIGTYLPKAGQSISRALF
jgi:methyl-accepting chemotaxis protein